MRKKLNFKIVGGVVPSRRRRDGATTILKFSFFLIDYSPKITQFSLIVKNKTRATEAAFLKIGRAPTLMHECGGGPDCR